MKECSRVGERAADVDGKDASIPSVLSDICIPEILDRVSSFLESNDIACGLRLINRAAAVQFRHRNVVRASQPSPHEAFLHRWRSPDALTALTRSQRQRLVCLTAVSGSLANLEVAISVAGLFPFRGTAEAAAAAGQLHVCQWLHQHGWPPCDSLTSAAAGGHQPICEWLLSTGCSTDAAAAVSAARHGHIDLMDWLMHQLDGAPSYVLLMAVAYGCDLPTLQRLYLSYRQRSDLVWIVDSPAQPGYAASSPTPDWRSKVQWLEAQGLPRTPTVCAAAAGCPDAVERLAWLRQRGYPADGSSVNTAARTGNVAALRYLLSEAGVRRDRMGSKRATLEAAEGGHLAALQVLHDHGVAVDPEVTAHAAARSGHLAVVAWLVQTFGGGGGGDSSEGGNRDGCEVALSAQLFAAAAGSGSVELMAWLRERGCEWSAAAFQAAAEAGCVAALEWLAGQGCPMPADGMPYSSAAYHGDKATLHCLRRLGCRWDPAGKTFTDVIASYARPEASLFVLPSLAWLLEAGCPVDWEEALERAARSQSPEVMSWVVAQEQRRQQGEAQLAVRE